MLSVCVARFIATGPWGNDCTDVSIQVHVPAGITSCEVSWTSWAIDSRDGENDRVLINDVEVWSAPARCWGSAGDGWELGPDDFPNPCVAHLMLMLMLMMVMVVVLCEGSESSRKGSERSRKAVKKAQGKAAKGQGRQ